MSFSVSKLQLHEIKENDTEIRLDQTTEWVAHAILACDEQLDQEPVRGWQRNRQINVELTTRRIDNIYSIHGKVVTEIQLICSRCAKAFKKKLNNKFHALYSKDPDVAGVAYLGKDHAKPTGRNSGHAGTGHASLDTDIEISYVSDDSIDLAELLQEQITLEIPFQPLCQEDCKGVCMQCGADQNLGRCPCKKITKENPFAVLEGLKLPGGKK